MIVWQDLPPNYPFLKIYHEWKLKKQQTYKPENNKFCKSEKITDTTVWQRNMKFIGHIYAKRAEDDSEKRQPSMLNYEKQ